MSLINIKAYPGLKIPRSMKRLPLILMPSSSRVCEFEMEQLMLLLIMVVKTETAVMEWIRITQLMISLLNITTLAKLGTIMKKRCLVMTRTDMIECRPMVDTVKLHSEYMEMVVEHLLATLITYYFFQL
jgi:hypothetical protein